MPVFSTLVTSLLVLDACGCSHARHAVASPRTAHVCSTCRRRHSSLRGRALVWTEPEPRHLEDLARAKTTRAAYPGSYWPWRRRGRRAATRTFRRRRRHAEFRSGATGACAYMGTKQANLPIASRLESWMETIEDCFFSSKIVE